MIPAVSAAAAAVRRHVFQKDRTMVAAANRSFSRRIITACDRRLDGTSTNTNCYSVIAPRTKSILPRFESYSSSASPAAAAAAAAATSTTNSNSIRRAITDNGNDTKSNIATTKKKCGNQTSSLLKTKKQYFNKVLIANRGEIAIRVARTCQRLKIPTVAIYTTQDRAAKSLHITECNEAVCIGDSYLNVSNILQAIRTTQSDAVHPGYGFLSENADFCTSIMQQQLMVNTTSKKNDKNGSRSSDAVTVAWLGPPANAILNMGCKVSSKIIAKKAGVTIVPGNDCNEELSTIDDALRIMNGINSNNGTQLDYPVLIKAAAGGGGKGMRICYNDQELIKYFPIAKLEGLKYFADDRLLIEKYVKNPHHIELQVVCSYNNNDNDNNGSTSTYDVAIFVERECSIQRRNQKVVEESPSTLLLDETRAAMMRQTAKLCHSVGYVGAGTVEWLVESTTTNTKNKKNEQEKQQHFYFLEMNTRLQVEHPITEAVSSVDLVEAMLHVGSSTTNGLPSDWYDRATIITTTDGNGNYDDNKDNNTNDDTTVPAKMNILVMPFKGHSIEGRIYAEDPTNGYLPSTGPLLPYKEPMNAITVDNDTSSLSNSLSYLRLDSGVAEGHVVTPHYDPMLSKIIAYGDTREDAIQILSQGLDNYVVDGVKNNVSLIRAVLRNEKFRENGGDTPTSFLDNQIHGRAGGKSSPSGSEGCSTLLSDYFNGVEFTNQEEEELAVSVALISHLRDKILGRPPVTTTTNSNDSSGSGAGVCNSATFTTTESSFSSYTVVVLLAGLFSSYDPISVNVVKDDSSDSTTKAYVWRLHDASNNKKVNDDDDDDDDTEYQREFVIDTVKLDLINCLAHVSLDGHNRTIQVLGDEPSGELRVQMYGGDTSCLIQSQREYELSRYMRPPIIEDTSELVMSPMPGTLISFSVECGDEVESGQDLCVVEAMKMQNIMTSPKKGTIVKLNVDVGEAVSTDQVLMEFGSKFNSSSSSNDDDGK